MQNILFVCSRNQWRSPTAERVWRTHPLIDTRSAGTSPNARHPITLDDIRWAEIVFVMEEKHKNRLLAAFPSAFKHKPIHVLDIPDEYKYMDPELIAEIIGSVESVLNLKHT